MKRSLLFFVVVFFVSFIYGQEELKKESIDYYFTYEDYVNNTPNLPEKAYITIEQENPNSIIYGGIFSESTNKKIKKGYTIWAIKYKGELYHNMLLTQYEIAQRRAFGKFSIMGKRFNVIILNTKEDKKAFSQFRLNPYGGGLVASALYKEHKNTWKDKNGNSYKVIFLDTQNSIISSTEKKNVIVRTLDTPTILELYKNDLTIIEKLKNNEYYLEDFLEFVNKENAN